MSEDSLIARAVVAVMLIGALIAFGSFVMVTVLTVNPTITPTCGYRVDVDGRVMVPQDLNGDGRITGDIEMGS